MSKNLLISMFVLISSISFAHAAGNPGPREQIKLCPAPETQASSSNDYAKQGKGLWMDCVNPIIKATTAKKSVLPFPSVDPSVVAACKAKHPKFGEGKVGN